MNTTVVYTAIFGQYDQLLTPKVVPDNCDFVCFTDTSVQSDVWQVRAVTRAHEDPTRNARMYKVLPHRYLGGYDVSVWIDGNILVRGDVTECIAKNLKADNLAAYDHAYAKHRDKNTTSDIRHSAYDEADVLLSLAKRGRVKDDPVLIQQQVKRYKDEGYEGTRTALTNTLFRRHNKTSVVEAMELWWSEIRRGSKRDQISFPYVLWKTGLSINWIEDNARENKYFVVQPHQT